MWLICNLLEFFVSVFLFCDEKNHFKQKLLLWPQIPFKDWILSGYLAILTCFMYHATTTTTKKVTNLRRPYTLWNKGKPSFLLKISISVAVAWFFETGIKNTSLTLNFLYLVFLLFFDASLGYKLLHFIFDLKSWSWKKDAEAGVY